MTKLYQLRQIGSVRDYVHAFETLVDEVGGELEQKSLHQLFKSGLKEHVRVKLEEVQLGKDEFDLGEMKSIVLNYGELDRNERSSYRVGQRSSPMVANLSEKKPVKCFYCGKIGHVRAICRKMLRDRQRGVSRPATPWPNENPAKNDAEEKPADERRQLSVNSIKLDAELQDPMYVIGEMSNGSQMVAWLGTAAQRTTISSRFVTENELRTEEIPPLEVLVADGRGVLVRRKAFGEFIPDPHIGNNQPIQFEALVMDFSDREYHMLLGIDWLRTNSGVIDVGQDILFYGPNRAFKNKLWNTVKDRVMSVAEFNRFHRKNTNVLTAVVKLTQDTVIENSEYRQELIDRYSSIFVSPCRKDPKTLD